MPQRKYFVATGILVFDFELFIGGRVQKDEELTGTCMDDNSLKLPTLLGIVETSYCESATRS